MRNVVDHAISTIKFSQFCGTSQLWVSLRAMTFCRFLLSSTFSPFLAHFQLKKCMEQVTFFQTFDDYLQGYTHPREYIVTEWPLPTTCSDIWSLVYDHDCSAVVVLCNPTSTVSNVSIPFLDGWSWCIGSFFIQKGN